MIKSNNRDDKFSKEKKGRNFGLKQIILQYSNVPIKRVRPNKRVGWIFKYINFIEEYVEPNKPVKWKIC